MSSKRRLREQRQNEAMERINAEGPGVIVKHGRAVPYCGCGARDGYRHDTQSDSWVCARCGYPSKGWYEAQQKDHVLEAMQEELGEMVEKYRRIKAKSDAQPKDQVYLNKKNTARGIIRGLATALHIWMTPHYDLEQVMEIERTYLNA